MLDEIQNMISLDWRRIRFRKNEDKEGRNNEDEVDSIDVYGWKDLYRIK